MYLSVYGTTSTNNYSSWLLTCPNGSDPTNGSNWSTWGTIAHDGTNYWTEASVQNVGGNNLVAILRNDNGTDLYRNTSANWGATWGTPTAIGLPGVATAGYAVSPWLSPLASGNWLLSWGVRYGTTLSTGYAISTDNAATFLDRIPWLPNSDGNQYPTYDGGYPTSTQLANGNIVSLYNRFPSGQTTKTDIWQVTFTEDYLCNWINAYDGCESFGSAWSVAGANATINNTHVHNGSNAIEINNNAGINDYAVRQCWIANPAQQFPKVAYSYWSYTTANEVNWASRISSSTTFNTGYRTVESVFGETSNHLEWYNGSAWQDTSVVIPQNVWNKRTAAADILASSVVGTLLSNNTIATASWGQQATGSPPLSVQYVGSSSLSTHNTIYWIDDFYVHQYTSSFPTVTVAVGALGAIMLGSIVVAGAATASGAGSSSGSGAVALGSTTASGTGAFKTTASGSVTLAALSPAGSGGFTATASGSVALAGLTVSGTATASAPGTASGSGTITLGALTVTGVGSFATTASGSIALAGLTVAGTGSFIGIGSSTGSGTVSLGSLAVSGAGGFGTSGHGTITLGSIIVTSAASGGGVGPLYLPYEFTSVLIANENETANDPFGIDPEQTVLITSGL